MHLVDKVGSAGVRARRIPRLTTRARLILILAVPAAGLLLTTAQQTLSEWNTTRAMARVAALANLSVTIGAAIHEMQKERGMAAGYIGSGGRIFNTTLLAQHQQTDGRLDDFRSELAVIDSRPLGSDFAALRNQVDGRFARLDAMRHAVDARTATVDDVLAHYSATIDAMLAITRLTIVSTDDHAIARLATAHAKLLQTKERLGMERALLTSAFANATLPPPVLARFQRIDAAHELYLNEFVLSANDAQRAFFTATVSGVAVDAVARIHQQLERITGAASAAVDPDYWFDITTTTIDQLARVENRLAADLLNGATAKLGSARLRMTGFIIIGALGVLTTILFAWFMITRILRDLGGEPAYAASVAGRIAAGDLTTEVVTAAGDGSSLLHAMHTMRTTLAHLITETNRAAAEVALGAEQFALGNARLSTRTHEQVEALSGTTARMAQMTHTVQQNAANAGRANQLASSAETQASKGREVVAQTITAMRQINAASDRIGDVTGVIDAIAFQTNLLALNAAVEAARAGDQGKGFGVVAAEVRSLAQRSADAAREIKALIGDSITKFENGTRMAEESGTMLAEIIESVRNVTAVVAEIAAASRTQSTGIEAVNAALKQLNELAQHNSALVKDSAAASKAMEIQANTLRELVAYFRLPGVRPPFQVPAAAAQPKTPPARLIAVRAG